MMCFECKKEVRTVLPGDVLVLENHHRYVFCRSCTQIILSSYIASTYALEADLAKREQQHEDFKLKSRLNSLYGKYGQKGR